MSEKRYTSQDMRHTAMDIQSHVITGPSDIVFDSTLCSAVAMLCQAADDAEELRTMRSTWLTPETSKALFDDCVSKTKEIYSLKSRLEAVVRVCDRFNNSLDNLIQTANDLGCKSSAESTKGDKIIITAILRAARGEGGAE